MFLELHISILELFLKDQRLFTLDTCCGYGYRLARELNLLFKGRRELTGRRQNRDAFQGVGPYLGTNPFQGAWPFKEKRTLPGAPASFSGFVCVTALGASRHPSPPRPGSGIITRIPFDRPGTTEATVSPRRPSYSSRRIFVKYFFLPLTARYGPDAPVPSIFRANWFGRWVVTHSLADSDFHQPMVTPPISTNTFPGVWWASALGALTRHLVHLAAPVLLIKSGPLGDSHSTPRLQASKPGFLTIYTPIPKSDDRFVHQDRCGPPPEFPLASPCPGIVHHLSGTIAHALAPPAWRAPAFTFIVPWGLEDTFLLTRALDSLVCVSRWAGWVADLATDLEHSLPGATSHLRPRPFLAKPEPAAAHRLGRRASDGPDRDD